MKNWLRMSATDPQDILDYWIGPVDVTPEGWAEKQQLWYAFDPKTDKFIEDQFGADLTAAEAGNLTDWETTLVGQLALIVLFDQFSRNLYRGTADVYRNDARAVELADTIINSGQLSKLNVPAHVLVFHAYHHAEDVARQEKVVALGEALLKSAPEAWRASINGNLEFMRGHCAVIQTFGRFPHRNKILGRTSTAEELSHLEKDSRSFGQ